MVSQGTSLFQIKPRGDGAETSEGVRVLQVPQPPPTPQLLARGKEFVGEYGRYVDLTNFFTGVQQVLLHALPVLDSVEAPLVTVWGDKRVLDGVEQSLGEAAIFSFLR
jgi:hypothetical protein